MVLAALSAKFACVFRLYAVVGQAQLVHAARLLQLSQRSEKNRRPHVQVRVQWPAGGQPRCP